MTRFSFVFTIPSIVLVIGREDDFSPSVKDVELITRDKIRRGEHRPKAIVVPVIACGKGVGYVKANDFPLDVLLNNGVDASVGVYSYEHDVVIGNGLWCVIMERIDLNGLGTIAKLPVVLISNAVRVVDELDFTGEEIDLIWIGIKSSNGSLNNAHSTVGGGGSGTPVLGSDGEGKVKTAELVEGVLRGIGGKDDLSVAQGPKDRGILSDGLVDELCLERSTTEVVRNRELRYERIRLVEGKGVGKDATVGVGNGDNVILRS